MRLIQRHQNKLFSICVSCRVLQSERERNDSVYVVTFSTGLTSRCALLLASICSRRPQMTSDPLSAAAAAAEPVWGSHHTSMLWAFRKWPWLSDLPAFWVRLKPETWSGSPRPPVVKEPLFFPPDCFKLLVKGRYWAVGVLYAWGHEPSESKGKHCVFHMETLTLTAGTVLQTCVIPGAASVSADLQSSRMTQDFIWSPDWTFHWLHKTCFIWKHFT